MDVYGCYAFVPETLLRNCDADTQLTDNEAMLDKRRLNEQDNWLSDSYKVDLRWYIHINYQANVWYSVNYEKPHISSLEYFETIK